MLLLGPKLLNRSLNQGLLTKRGDGSTLNLNFALTKALDPRITFTRASTATYVDASGIIQTAASGVPRFDHDPVTGESLGLLIEEARTNLLLNSATLSTQTRTVTAVAQTLSFYGTGTITLTGVSTAGPLVGTGANNRVSLTFTPTAGSLVLTVSGSVTNAQLEAGSIPTSYIPTLASTVTRAADVATLTGVNFTSWFNASAGTIFTKGRGPAVISGSQPNIWAFDDTPSNNFILARVSGTGATSTVFVGVSSTVVATLVSSSFTLRSTFNQASAYALNDFATTVNGGTVATDTLGAVPVVNKATFGSRAGFWLNGTIARFTYYPTRLSNVALQALTAP